MAAVASALDEADELEEDAVKELFFTEAPFALTQTEMADYLQLNRFGSFLDEKTK